MLPKVSIITVNFNGQSFLSSFFASLNSLTYPNYEIIFIDNDSTDGSVDLVKNNYPQVKLIANKKNFGFALANNEAVKKAKGKYLFFINNDLKVHPAVVKELVVKMEEDSRLGIAGCRIMSYDGKRHFHTGIGIDVLGYPVVNTKVFYVEGSALMIKKELFTEMGGFDSAYFMFHEDIDLAWRVWLLGYRVEAFSKAIVYHVGGASAAGGEKTKGRYRSSLLRRYFSERNNIRTLLKNYHWLALILVLPIYLLINLGEIIFCLFTSNFKLIYLYFKAYFWNIMNFKETMREREKIQASRAVSDWSLLKNMYWGSGKLVALRKAGLPKFN